MWEDLPLQPPLPVVELNTRINGRHSWMLLSLPPSKEKLSITARERFATDNNTSHLIPAASLATISIPAYLPCIAIPHPYSSPSSLFPLYPSTIREQSMIQTSIENREMILRLFIQTHLTQIYSFDHISPSIIYNNMFIYIYSDIHLYIIPPTITMSIRHRISYGNGGTLVQ